MKRSRASVSESWATFWWASRILGVSCGDTLFRGWWGFLSLKLPETPFCSCQGDRRLSLGKGQCPTQLKYSLSVLDRHRLSQDLSDRGPRIVTLSEAWERKQVLMQLSLRASHRMKGSQENGVAISTRHALWYLLSLELALEARGDKAIGVEALSRGFRTLSVVARAPTACLLQAEEGQDGLHLAGIAAVSHGAALGGQSAASHPLGILLLLVGTGMTVRNQLGSVLSAASALACLPPSLPASHTSWHRR